MITMETLFTKMSTLLTKVNKQTGKSDQDLTTAINSLIDQKNIEDGAQIEIDPNDPSQLNIF